MAQFVRLMRYLKPYWWQIAVGLICLLLATPAQLFHPLVWKFIVDEVIVNHKVWLLTPALLVMVAVHLVGVGLSAARTYLLGVVGQRFVFDLRNELYKKLQAHSFRFFHESLLSLKLTKWSSEQSLPPLASLESLTHRLKSPMPQMQLN